MSRWLVGLPLSIALHGALVVAIVAFARSESLPPALIVDLAAIVAGHESGSPTAAGSPAPPSPAPKAKGDGPRVPRTASPSAPASAPVPAPAPTPLSVREVTPPVPTPEPVAPTPVRRDELATAGGTGASTAAATAPTQAGSAGSLTGVPGGQQGGGTNVTATGPGGTGGDRVASLGVAGGTGTATLGVDDAGYLARLRERIQAALRYPPAARRRGVSGTVQLEINIEPSGVVGTVSVIASSAHEMLDKAAVDAARSVPRMPLPGAPRAVRVRLPIVFELQ